MNKKQVKFGIASTVIVMAIGYLVMSGISETSVYYMTVAELIENKNAIYDEGVRVQGKVVNGTINKDSGSLRVMFEIADEEKPPVTIRVNYEGVIPDLFEPGRDVVVEGRYTKEDIFYAATLLTSCPSKYEASEIEKSKKGENL